jgi:hypothetical protein
MAGRVRAEHRRAHPVRADLGVGRDRAVAAGARHLRQRVLRPPPRRLPRRVHHGQATGFHHVRRGELGPAGHHRVRRPDVRLAQPAHLRRRAHARPRRGRPARRRRRPRGPWARARSTPPSSTSANPTRSPTSWARERSTRPRSSAPTAASARSSTPSAPAPGTPRRAGRSWSSPTTGTGTRAVTAAAAGGSAPRGWPPAARASGPRRPPTSATSRSPRPCWRCSASR